MLALSSVWMRLSDGKPLNYRKGCARVVCKADMAHTFDRVCITFCKARHGDSVTKQEYYYFCNAIFIGWSLVSAIYRSGISSSTRRRLGAIA